MNLWCKILMNISFVIIGLNEGELLIRCFESVVKAVNTSLYIKKHEIIYVDSGSVDASVSIAKKHGFRVLSLIGDRCAAAARKVGQLNAHGDFILFLDGDMELDPNFIDYVMDNGIFRPDIVCGVVGNRKEVSINKDGTELVLTKDFYGKKSKGKLTHLGGAVLLRKLCCSDKEVYFDENQALWEESLLLYGIIENGGYVLSLDIPFITHNNKKKKNHLNIIKSFISSYGTGYYFARLIYESISKRYFKSLIMCQYRFFIFILTVSILMPLLYVHLSMWEFVIIFLCVNFLFALCFGYRLLANYYFRFPWIFIFPFVKVKQFILKVKDEGRS